MAAQNSARINKTDGDEIDLMRFRAAPPASNTKAFRSPSHASAGHDARRAGASGMGMREIKFRGRPVFVGKANEAPPPMNGRQQGFCLTARECADGA